MLKCEICNEAEVKHLFCWPFYAHIFSVCTACWITLTESQLEDLRNNPDASSAVWDTPEVFKPRVEPKPIDLPDVQAVTSETFSQEEKNQFFKDSESLSVDQLVEIQRNAVKQAKSYDFLKGGANRESPKTKSKKAHDNQVPLVARKDSSL